MRIGVVSDTHNHLANVARIVEIFNRCDVAHVVHTGDITQAKTLRVFAELSAPLSGVFGNNDLERASLDATCTELGCDFATGPRTLTIGDHSITVVHDPLDIPSDAQPIVLHGHNHRTVIEREDDHLIFNPGECAGHQHGHNTVGLLHPAAREVELVRF